MEIIAGLILFTVLLVIAVVAVFFWAVKSNQFDDLEGPAHRILMDDDGPDVKKSENKESDTQP